MQIRDIRQTTWFWMDNAIMDMDITVYELSVYCLLCRMANDGVCYPSIRYVSDKLSISPTTVNKAIRSLVDKKVLGYEAGDSEKSNVYTLLHLVTQGVSPDGTRCTTTRSRVCHQVVHNNTNITRLNNNIDASLPTDKLLNTSIPPNQDWVVDYCKERQKGVDPIKWFNFYAAKGWMVGKNKMKDWRAAVRTWEQSNQTPVATGLRV